MKFAVVIAILLRRATYLCSNTLHIQHIPWSDCPPTIVHKLLQGPPWNQQSQRLDPHILGHDASNPDMRGRRSHTAAWRLRRLRRRRELARLFGQTPSLHRAGEDGRLYSGVHSSRRRFRKVTFFMSCPNADGATRTCNCFDADRGAFGHLLLGKLAVG
ncbi:hypothetical protein EDC01DRAFT_320735 [Geopyxis carbonaria]|nr:hypothetical protein EDC01DRAFT_320735 [Geopyxis carbonaria]